jgi:transposase
MEYLKRMEQLTLEEYQEEILRLEEKIGRLDEKIEEAATAEAFMSYLGLIPREYSSGKKRKQGGITKRGSGHLRKLLTESSWHYARPNQVSKRLEQRREDAPKTTTWRPTLPVFRNRVKDRILTAPNQA